MKAMTAFFPVVLLLVAGPGFCAEKQAEYMKTYPLLPKAQVPLVEKDPVLDGKLDEAFCKKATKLSAFRPLVGGENGVGPVTDTWIATTKDTLYMAFRCQEKDMKGLKGGPKKAGWDDDALEIFLRVGNLPSEPYHHFRVNSAGAYEDEYNRSGMWDAKGVKATAGREAEAWVVEIAFPFSALEKPNDKNVLAGPWRLNIIRTRPLHKGDTKPGGAVKLTVSGEPYNEESAWSPTETITSHLPHMFGYIYLEAFGGKKP